MHAYGGSKEFTDLLLKLGEFKGVDFYFGFASVINLKSPKTKDVIKHIPKDNILIESDLESTEELDTEISLMLNFIAECKSWNVEEAVEITTTNAKRFFSANTNV